MSSGGLIIKHFSLKILIFFTAFALFNLALFAKELTKQNGPYQKYRSLSGKSFLTPQEINKLYYHSINNPVSSLAAVSSYDKNLGHENEIGFCFGRAMAAHLLAKKMGLKDSSIKKIFIIGDLRSNPFSDFSEWRFHVTTIIKGKNNTWFAMDPIMFDPDVGYHPMTAKDWIRSVRDGWDKWQAINPNSKNKEIYQAKIYMLDSSFIMPDIRQLNVPEMGKNIIDLNFVPKENGFSLNEKKNKNFGLSFSDSKDPEARRENVYYPLQNVSIFFLKDESQQNQFNLLKIDILVRDESGKIIQEINYDYFNYFVHLIDSLFDESKTNPQNKFIKQRTNLNSSELRPFIGGMKLPFLNK